MLLLGVTSLTASLLDIKPYVHLQLVPHMTTYHQVSRTGMTTFRNSVLMRVQFWRILVHPLAFVNSTELLVAELLLYNVGVGIER